MTARLLTLHAGQTGKIYFHITAAPGSSIDLIGGVLVGRKPVSMRVQDDIVLIDPLPVGCHLYEIRCGGVTVLHGEIAVAPSALAAVEGQVVWDATVDLTQPLLEVNIVQNPGPSGERGKNAYELAVQEGFSGTLSEWLDSLKGDPGKDGVAPTPDEVAGALVPALSVDFAFEGPTASYNANGNYFILGSSYLQGGLLMTQFGWRVRFDNLNGCCTDPVYLGVWELGEDGSSWVRLGVSLDTQVQQLSSDIRWTFEPGDIRLSGRPLRFCLLATPEDDWRTDLIMALRTATTADEETRVYAPGEYAAVPKFFFKGRKGPATVSMGGGSLTRHMTSGTADSKLFDGIVMGPYLYLAGAKISNLRVSSIIGHIVAANGQAVRLKVNGQPSTNTATATADTPAVWTFDEPVQLDKMANVITIEGEDGLFPNWSAPRLIGEYDDFRAFLRTDSATEVIDVGGITLVVTQTMEEALEAEAAERERQYKYLQSLIDDKGGGLRLVICASESEVPPADQQDANVLYGVPEK